jgi:hypothetical protein
MLYRIDELQLILWQSNLSGDTWVNTPELPYSILRSRRSRPLLVHLEALRNTPLETSFVLCTKHIEGNATLSTEQGQSEVMLTSTPPTSLEGAWVRGAQQQTQYLLEQILPATIGLLRPLKWLKQMSLHENSFAETTPSWFMALIINNVQLVALGRGRLV